MRLSRAALLGTVALACGSCNLVLTDYETSGGTGAGDGAGAAPPLAAIPLQVSGDVDQGIQVAREGFFRLDADAGSRWQWLRWFDLARDPGAQRPFPAEDHPDGAPTNTNSRTHCFWTAVHALEGSYPIRSCNYSESDQFGADFQGAPSFDDVLPVAYGVGGTVTSFNVTTAFKTTVHASGLVWSWTRVVNTEDTYPMAASFAFAFGQIALRLDDFATPGADDGGLIQQGSGDAAVLSVLIASEKPAVWAVGVDASFPANGEPGGLFKVDGESLPLGTPRTYVSAFFLGSRSRLASEKDARARDLVDSRIEGAVGATPLFDGARDPTNGSFTLTMADAATEASITLDARAHFEPVFTVDGWTAPTWVVRRGGTVLASDAANGSALATLKARRLTFQILDTIPASAPEIDRTFTIRRD